jgi:hypothetical protein
MTTAKTSMMKGVLPDADRRGAGHGYTSPEPVLYYGRQKWTPLHKAIV